MLTFATVLTLKAPTTTAADDFINIFSLFLEKIRLDVSSESSSRQRIHMKNHGLFSSKNKSKKLKYRLLQFLLSALRVNFGTKSSIKSMKSSHTKPRKQI